MADLKLHILGDAIQYSQDYVDINDLTYLRENPRVYECVHGEPGFASMTRDEQQDIIEKRLLKELSVTKLIPEVRRHRGLMEPVLVRWDTKAVIEGNSRLAVYRFLHHEEPIEDWQFIPCNIVSSLTDLQQAAYLNQIHVKGKTRWSAYEKDNFAYMQRKAGHTFAKIGEIFGESPSTIRTRVKVIELMRSKGEARQSHFSYYNVIVRTPAIREAAKDKKIGDVLFGKLKEFGKEEKKNEFTAQELRERLPRVLKKPKVKRKWVSGDLELDEAYQRAKISSTQDKVRRAYGILDDISRRDVKRLTRNSQNALKQDIRKLGKQVDRLKGIVDQVLSVTGN